MSSVRTLNSEHSIQEVIFSIHFVKQLNNVDIERLLVLKELLKSNFSKVEDLKLASFKIQGQKVEHIAQNDLAGLFFSNAKEDGTTLDWAIRIQNDFVSVSCLDYKGWLKIWPKALNYLKTISELIINKENSIKTINLRYINRFISDNQKQYPWADIFNIKSPYLTHNIKNTRSLWHLYQGWMESDAIIKHIYLNNLNLEAGVENEELITTISLLRQAQCEQVDLEDLDEVMNGLHNGIKNILTDVLAANLAEKIGLNK